MNDHDEDKTGDHIPYIKMMCHTPHVNMVWRLYYYGKITRFDCYRELGKYYGYPQCCIDNFVKVDKTGNHPGLYMNEKYGESKNNCEHVECLKCRTKNG